MENTDEIQQRINECYNNSLTGIEAFLGFELSIIEKARLRELARANVKRLIEQEKMYDAEIERNGPSDSSVVSLVLAKAAWNLSNPQIEATRIFLHDYYGVPHLSRGWRELFDKEAYEKVNPDVWRRIRDDSHKP